MIENAVMNEDWSTSRSNRKKSLVWVGTFVERFRGRTESMAGRVESTGPPGGGCCEAQEPNNNTARTGTKKRTPKDKLRRRPDALFVIRNSYFVMFTSPRLYAERSPPFREVLR